VYQYTIRKTWLVQIAKLSFDLSQLFRWSALAKIGEYSGRAGDTGRNPGTASSHLLIGGNAEATMAVGGARRFKGAAQGIKPAMDRTEASSHGLGSFQVPPKTHCLYCSAALILQCAQLERCHAKDA
jgi:hypothetical protein